MAYSRAKFKSSSTYIFPKTYNKTLWTHSYTECKEVMASVIKCKPLWTSWLSRTDSESTNVNTVSKLNAIRLHSVIKHFVNCDKTILTYFTIIFPPQDSSFLSLQKHVKTYKLHSLLTLRARGALRGSWWATRSWGTILRHIPIPVPPIPWLWTCLWGPWNHTKRRTALIVVPLEHNFILNHMHCITVLLLKKYEWMNETNAAPMEKLIMQYSLTYLKHILLKRDQRLGCRANPWWGKVLIQSMVLTFTSFCISTCQAICSNSSERMVICVVVCTFLINMSYKCTQTYTAIRSLASMTYLRGLSHYDRMEWSQLNVVLFGQYSIQCKNPTILAGIGCWIHHC
jgi:hypothetical protein